MADRPGGTSERAAPTQPGAVALSVVVPVHRARSTLAEVCDRLVATLRSDGGPFEVILVDDGSPDGAWTVIEELAERIPEVRGVRLARNFGQTPAWCAGIEQAAGAIVATIDADLDTFPEDLPLVVDALRAGAPVANGARSGRALRRGIPSRLFNRRMRAAGLPYTDMGCGMMAMRRDLALEVLAHGDLRRGYRFKVLVAQLAGGVVEVPVRSGPTSPSSYRFADLLSAGLEVDVAARGTVFGGTAAFGYLVAAFGSVLAVAAGVGWAAPGWDGAPWVLGWSILVVLAGTTIALIATVGNLVLRAFHDQGTPFYRVAEVAGDDR